MRCNGEKEINSNNFSKIIIYEGIKEKKKYQ